MKDLLNLFPISSEELNIFLISSEELEPERKTIVALANSLNATLGMQGIHVTIVECENLGAFTEDNSEEHNNKLSKCDICIALFWTKIEERIKKQFDLAVELLNRNRLKKVYPYFKEGNEATTALKEFRDSLFAKHRLLYTSFGNPDTLKAHFLLQVIEYIKFHHNRRFEHNNIIEIENDKVLAAGGREYVDLTNVPFAGNNERYKYLQQNIRDKQELMTYIPSDHADYEKHATELQEMKGKLSKMGTNLWDTALVLTGFSGSEHRPRFRRAMELFFNGDDKGAQAVLNEEEIEESGRIKRENVERYRINKEYLRDYYRFLSEKQDYDEVIIGYNKAIDFYRNLANVYPEKYQPMLADILSSLGDIRIQMNDGEVAEKELNEAIQMIMKYKHKKGYDTILAKCFLYLGRNYYYCLDKADDAIKALHQSLDIYNSKNGADYNNEIAMIYGNLGNAYLWKKDSPTAIQMYNKAVSTIENAPNKTIANNSKLALLLNNLAWLYYKNGEIEKAEPLARRAVELEEKKSFASGSDSKDISIYKDTLDRILEEKDKANETKEAKTEPAAADISAEITYIERNGRNRKKTGIVFTINGEKIPVFFDSTVQTMIYVCTLLCKKLDTKMYRDKFYREDSRTRLWLQKVFEAIYPYREKNFNKWLERIKNNDGHPLSQAKSQIVTKIKNALAGQADGIKNYCIVETKFNKYRNSYYDLKIHPDNIIVPQEWHSLIDDKWRVQIPIFYEAVKPTRRRARKSRASAAQ